MLDPSRIEEKPFTGVRIVAHSPLGFEAVVAALKGHMGRTQIEALVELAKQPITLGEFVEEIEERLVGAGGFILFAELNPDGWRPKFGAHRRTVRWIFGYPLNAITMIRHDLSSGLFAPVELLVTEDEDGVGAVLSYVRPSSLIVVDDNPPLLSAARALDERLEALVAGVTAPSFEPNTCRRRPLA